MQFREPAWYIYKAPVDIIYFSRAGGGDPVRDNNNMQMCGIVKWYIIYCRFYTVLCLQYNMQSDYLYPAACLANYKRDTKKMFSMSYEIVKYLSSALDVGTTIYIYYIQYGAQPPVIIQWVQGGGFFNKAPTKNEKYREKIIILYTK